MKKPILLTLLLLIILLLSLITFLISNTGIEATGQIHGTFSTMIHSSPESYSSPALAMGIIMGTISIIIFVIFLYIGLYSTRNSKKILWPWSIGLILYLAIFFLGILDYISYLRSDSYSTFFGFPTPTAWMLFGIYLFPFYFTLFYILKFKYWILNPESEKKFKELIK